jgi:hypothetical protein
MAKRLAIKGGLTAVLLGLLLASAATPASACDSPNQTVFGISPGCFDLQASGAPNSEDLAPAFLQAGGHPDRLEFGLRMNAPAEPVPLLGPDWPPEALKDLYIDLPPGWVASPSALATCPLDQLQASAGGETAPNCPPASQAGLVKVTIPSFEGRIPVAPLPLYNLKPPPGVTARFGLNLFGRVSTFDGKLTPSAEPHLRIELRNLNQAPPIDALDVTLWGVPADPSHDAERACPAQLLPTAGGSGCPTGTPRRTFLRLPTSCTGPTLTSLQVDSWTHPGAFQTAAVVSHLPPSLFGDPAEPASYPAPYPGLDAAQWGPPAGLTGCDQPGFAPSVSVRPSSSAAAEPAGLEVQLRTDQGEFDNPDAVAPSDLRDATVELPPQLMVNASLANGLGACSEEEVGLDSDRQPSCPASSTLGTVEARTPLLEAPLRGSIYFNSSQATTSGLQLLVYLVAGNDGAMVKVPATISVDRASGQVTTRLRDLPQLPISELSLHFFAGQRAPFVTPAACGAYRSAAHLTPWARAMETEAGDQFSIDSGAGGSACPTGPSALPLRPRFIAGVADPIAGASSPLRLELGRGDGQQPLASFQVSLPAGLSASLAGVERCPEASLEAIAGRELDGKAELVAPSCPPGSQVGTALVDVGSGSEPLELKTGRIYLAGPYGGAPLSLAIVLPAVAGQLDLGTVLLRSKLSINPSSGQLKLAGELPLMQEGVPLNLRRVLLDLDRPGFMRNPTSCRAAAIEARVGGVAGATADSSMRFQVHDCGALGFGPRLQLQLLGGAGAARHAAHPSMRFLVRPRLGGANLAKAVITLPASEQLDPTHLHGICSVQQFAAKQCPVSTRYGSVRAVSPALGDALSGPLYLRESKRGFPDVAVHLEGELGIELSGRIEFSGGRARLVLSNLPDLPLSRLALTLSGGSHGLFVNNRNLCREGAGITARMWGANGRLAVRRTRLGVEC